MKIIGFAQLHNELSNGNLENWFKSMTAFCDFIYIYDQNSTDGSKVFYKKFPNTVIIESAINDFENELSCKQKLLNLIKKEHPDTDWIYWMDGDTILDGRLTKNNGELIRRILNHFEQSGELIEKNQFIKNYTIVYNRINNLFLSKNNITKIYQPKPIIKNRLLKKLQKKNDNLKINYTWYKFLVEKIRSIFIPKKKVDGIALGHLNLWRSDTFYRIDSNYNWLNERGVIAFWKNLSYLNFNVKSGMHKSNCPEGFKNIIRIEYFLIHKGFSTENLIKEKIDRYAKQDPKDWPGGSKVFNYTINRLKSEVELKVKRIPDNIFPSWYEIMDDNNPINKPKLIDIINNWRLKN